MSKLYIEVFEDDVNNLQGREWEGRMYFNLQVYMKKEGEQGYPKPCRVGFASQDAVPGAGKYEVDLSDCVEWNNRKALYQFVTGDVLSQKMKPVTVKKSV